MTTVRDAFFDVLRRYGMTTMFSNPGSTEIPLLARFPDDIDFVLCLHEASVVGAATGWSLGRQRPALALLHTTAGLGNAVGAIATARVNRAPMVIVVGQQDRRHLAYEPFLAGELEGLAGRYPVWTATPARAADVPALVSQARHRAVAARGPAVVIVPMDDWDQPLEEQSQPPAPLALEIGAGIDRRLCSEVARRLLAARAPVIVTGAGADHPRAWAALAELAGLLRCPVWQEPFGARAGFPQDSERFAGHLPAGRAAVREALGDHDVVLVAGAAALRQYGYEPGPLFADAAEVIVVTDDLAEASRSVADLAVLTPLPGFCELLTRLVARRAGVRPEPLTAGRQLSDGQAANGHSPDGVGWRRGPGQRLRAEDVFAALRARLPADAILVEESPSSRPQLQDMVPARAPLGFLSAAMGGLGFAMPAAMGFKLACPQRPVVAVVGDGSSLYACQSLWSAQRYRAGVLYVVLSNGGYAVMDQLAAQANGRPPWPSFSDVDIGQLARSLGCPSVQVQTCGELARVLDDTIPTLASRVEPLLVDVAVQPASLPFRHAAAAAAVPTAHPDRRPA
ncbi:MAG: thiamine pyrophosphate-dependent enzyme [Streptosporangiaceae bacterium]